MTIINNSPIISQSASEPVLCQMRSALLAKLSATADPQLQLFRTSIPVSGADKPAALGLPVNSSGAKTNVINQ